MSGLKVLKEVLGSLSEAERFEVRTFREIVSSSQWSKVRNVLCVGTVFGVQEFEYSKANSLIGDKVDGDVEPSYGFPDTSVHLYRVSKLLRSMSSSAESMVFMDASLRDGRKSGVYEAVPSFDAVCRDYDVRFTQELRPSVQYSIVTPAVRIEFPYIYGCRGSSMGVSRTTDGTAVIAAPFSITPNPEMKDILNFFNSELTPNDYLYDAETVFEQANRVIHAVRNSSEFGELTGNYVQLNSEVEERLRREDIAAIR